MEWPLGMGWRTMGAATSSPRSMGPAALRPPRPRLCLLSRLLALTSGPLWGYQSDNFAFEAAIDLKVRFVESEDARVALQFGHMDEAGIRQLHVLVAIFCKEVSYWSGVFLQMKRHCDDLTFKDRHNFLAR